MPRKTDPNSEASRAKRLSEGLGFKVSRKMLQCWEAKGYPLDDISKLKRALKNQERQPKAMKQAKKKAAKDSNQPAPTPAPEDPKTPGEGKILDADLIELELDKLQKELLIAQDYDEARTTKTKISGLREILKELREQRHFIRITEAIEAASIAAVASKAAWEAIEDELPPQLNGLTAPQMKVKLRDFARMKANELSEIFNPPT